MRDRVQLNSDALAPVSQIEDEVLSSHPAITATYEAAGRLADDCAGSDAERVIRELLDLGCAGRVLGEGSLRDIRGKRDRLARGPE